MNDEASSLASIDDSMRALNAACMELRMTVPFKQYSLDHRNRNTTLEMNRSSNVHSHHSIVIVMLRTQVGAELHNALDIRMGQCQYNENSLRVLFHQFNGVSEMIPMSMSDQDIVNVQILLCESLRQLHRMRVRIPNEWVTQKRIDQNRNSSCLNQEASVSQPNHFRYHCIPVNYGESVMDTLCKQTS